MTKEEYLAIEDKIEDINFKIYECHRELKGLNRFLDYLKNVYPKTEANDKCINVTEDTIKQKEYYIRLLKKERNYYQEYQLYYLEYEREGEENDWKISANG